MIHEHGSALEADLIKVGLRLRDCPNERFTWRDLHVFVKHVDADSSLYRAMFPESAEWGLTNQLLADIADVAHWFVWVRQGHEGDPPQRITRPGVVNDPKRRKKGTAMKMSQAKDVYAAVGPGGASPMSEAEREAKLAVIFGRA